jgi:hypothetical protein
MKNLLRRTFALVAFASLTLATNAVPIAGGISLAGGYTADTGDINTANAFTSFSNVIVTTTSGSYLPVPPATPATQNPFVFDPFPAGGIIPLWTFNHLGLTYSYDLLSLQPIEQPGDNTLTLKGSGKLSITGFEDASGSWVLTANQAAGTFSFSSSNGATGPFVPNPGPGVPDGGATVAMLGFALILLGSARHALRK